MLQESLLLNYKIRITETKELPSQIKYDYIKGIWEIEKETPFVNQMFNNQSDNYGASLVTATREGIDRSERS